MFRALASRLAALLLTCPFATAVHAEVARNLPVYVEDNHAGSFQFFASTLDLDQQYALVLFDAHPDDSAPSEPSAIREGLRRVTTEDELQTRLISWRRLGTVQSFDWIIPLTPRPIARVIWVPQPGTNLDPAKAHWTVARLADLQSQIPPTLPVVVSLDLDYFAGLGEREREGRFQRVWKAIARLPRLSAVSVAISRPWLTDDSEASHLLLLVLKSTLAISSVDLRLEPFGIEGPDRSEQAKRYYRAGREPPRFDVESASRELRSLLLASADRCVVRLDPERWQDTLTRWRAEGNAWRVVLDGTDADSDGVARPPADSAPDLRIEGGPPGLIQGTTWLTWTPTRWSYNVLPDLPSGKTFVGIAPPVVEYKASVLSRTRGAALDAATWRRALPGPGGSGVLRISAELDTERGTEHTAAFEIRQGLGQGFREGIAEQFGLPYVFGAGFLRRGALRGPDTGAGNDCANFLVSAWRRSGRRLPWCNPAQLRRHLVCLARHARTTDALEIPLGALDQGLVVHLGSHVAALWEDRPPVGILQANDLVVHHLGGRPEIMALGALLSRRADSNFDLYVAPRQEVVAWIAVGGDLMPGLNGPPPIELQRAMATADLSVANLETTVGGEGPASPRRYTFAVPPERLAAIGSLGIAAVSLANNHSDDFGPGGLANTLDALRSRQIASFGAGPDRSSSTRPWRTRVKSIEVAFLGVYLSDDAPTTANAPAPGTAVLPRDERELAAALAQAHRDADCVIVLPHWGDEGQPVVNSEQKRWARWLIQHGADAVVGSGAHVVQRRETIEGAPVFYSLGNLWFDGHWHPEARRAAVAFLGLDAQGRIAETRLEAYPQ